MEMFIEQGASRRECEQKIAEKYKRPFHIWSEKKVRIGGFWGMFTREGVEVEFYFAPMLNKNPAWQTYQAAAPVSFPVSDNLLMQRMYPEQRMYPSDQVSRNTAFNLEEEKKKVLAAARKNLDDISANGREASQQILDSLKEIKNSLASGGKKEEHPAFIRAADLLNQNDFSPNYVKKMIDRLRAEMTLDDLDDPKLVEEKLVEWIGESISIFKEEKNYQKPKFMVLVGPTGVGKTTTIAKLAAIYGVGTSGLDAVDVRMITIDAFRICAKEQLESIGNIMQIPVCCVVSKQALGREITINSGETDLFLIDTIGKSPKDAAKIGEMKEILDGCPKYAVFHLVISANTKTSDIEEIMRQFEIFNYRSIIFTKMDETDRIGNLISALAEKGKSVSYITDGQALHENIDRASVVRFLTSLEGFKINMEQIENRFPSEEID